MDWAKRKAVDVSRPEPLSLALVWQHQESIPHPLFKKSEPKRQKPTLVKKRLEKKVLKVEPHQKTRILYDKAAPKPEQKEKVQSIALPETYITIEPGDNPELEHPGEREERIALLTTSKEYADKDSHHTLEDEAPESSPLTLKEFSPVYKNNPTPKYPRTAKRRGYEGTVLLDVLVNMKGRVEECRLSQSSGYPVLDRAAMISVKEWLFEPGRRGDKEVEMWVKVPVSFKLK